MIKLLIADDSALMRKFLRQVFVDEADFDLCLARNGAEAVELARSFKPDVITLDINMPEMDGLTCLSRIMVECPRPVVMVSSLTTAGAEATLEALGLGAVDFIPKPNGTVSLHIDSIRAQLVSKVRNAARARLPTSRRLVERIRAAQAAPPPRPAPPARASALRPEPGRVDGLVTIGVSTGGPGAIEAIIPRLPADFPWPILVAQHMPESFTGVFARRIDGLSKLEVIEVAKPAALRPGTVYVGRGDADLVVGVRNGSLTAIPVPASQRYLWHPSVDRMVASAMEHVEPSRLLGVLLTGMGDDGAAAMAELKARGGRTIAEAEETAVVWGMPGELVRRGGAGSILPLDRIADQLCRWTH